MANEATKVFGESRMEDLRDAFYESGKMTDSKMPIEHVGWSLRAQGLCPTKRQLKDLAQSLGDRNVVSCDEFLIFAAQVGVPYLNIENMSILFLPYDPHNTGVVSERIFRHIMRNIGETFTDDELDQILAETRFDKGKIKYVDFLNNIAKHSVT